MFKKILLTVMTIFLGGIVATAPVFAADCTCPDGTKGVPTAILANGCACDSGNGNSIVQILQLVINIMSVGIGIFGVIGITVVGIQYLTAGGNEEKTRKAKTRLFEIVIGLVVYAIIYALLDWLLPSFGN